MIVRHILSFSLILLISTVYKSVTVNINEDVMIRSAKPIKNKTWENWNGEIYISPSAIFEPSTLEDLIDIVKLAKAKNKTIRCAAQGHTVSSLSVTKNYLVVVTNLKQITIQKHPKCGWTVTAEAGISLSELDNALRNHDPPLTLDSEAFLDIFRVSGVVAVGAHGSKTSSGIMSDQLCSMKIVTGSGEVYEFSEEISKSEFNAAKVNLGLLGIIYSLTFRAQLMYNLRVNDVYAPITEWFNPQTIKNLLDSSDGIEMNYYPFNGFNQSDPNPLDPNKDLVLVKNFVRTGESVSFTQQQIEKLRETQIQDNINQKKLFKSLLQNPEATPNVSSTIWKSIMSNGNTSFVFQAPDTFHFIAGYEIVKNHLIEIGFKVDPDFSNVAAEFSHVIQTVTTASYSGISLWDLYEFARKGKFPLNRVLVIRIIKSTKALLSNTFDNDPKTLYCHMDFDSVIGTPGWEEFMQLIAQRYFDKYKAKPHWGKQWEFIPNVKSYLSDVLSDQIKQFEKVRAKYDPDKIFFDNKSLQDIFSCALYSSNSKC
ncbi:8680_t:CDS:2 [Cetraspora pellucida]|uniref:D-arabinono-1,4-lactone oxidase n=1 Tax=Cetraspora pellucida TaxID=1433469 RepID=A0A9N9GTI5_9GLOM|nr:8680_t:CDS:2 [Cetraspora pellucida]